MLMNNTITVLKHGLLPLLVSIVLSGCSSIGKGIAEAVLEKSDTEDTRICQVLGQPFEGIAPTLTKGRTKVLMVHGVGDHLPGYSTAFLEKLAKALGVSDISSRYKDIALFSLLQPEKNLGNLRVVRLQNANKTKELWFYELTWSEITRPEKALLSFDNSGEYSFRRAGINDMLKKFSNDTGPDPIIYLGESRTHILRAFSQSVCWMGKKEWNEIPDHKRDSCVAAESFTPETKDDDMIFVSHSLGSRITMDGLQRMASVLENPEKYATKNYNIPVPTSARNILQQKKATIYMLSNQLPMLQLGRNPPEVTGQEAQYCQPDGSKYNSRLFSETSVIAFSDPNDILSYAIPHDFKEKYLDSRLCSKITNVNINVTKIMDVFGLGQFANPLSAHTGYDTDDRVVAMIAEGIGNKHTAPLVKEKCQWTAISD